MLFKATSVYHSGVAPPERPLISEHVQLGIENKKTVRGKGNVPFYSSAIFSLAVFPGNFFPGLFFHGQFFPIPESWYRNISEIRNFTIIFKKFQKL